VLVVGGTLTVEGRVSGDVLVIGGDVLLRQNAVISGDVATVGGRVEAEDGARVFGRSREVSLVLPNVHVGDLGIGFHLGRWFGTSRLVAAAAFTSYVARLAVMVVLLATVLLLVPARVEAIAATVRASWPRAFFAGLATQLLAAPALAALALALLLSIIGIPLIPLVGLLALTLALTALVGFAGACAAVRDATSSVAGSAVIGAAFVLGFGLVTRLAWLWTGHLSWWVGIPLALSLALEYVVWSAGLGAAVLSRLGSNAPVGAPPQIPAQQPLVGHQG